MIDHRVVEIALAVCVLLSGTAVFASTTDFTGPVVSVLDGDTIEVLHNNRAERIRLNGVDCPNYSQVAAQNRVAFNSAAEAEAAGYRVAGNCL